MNISKTIQYINKYIQSKGYEFEKGTVENLYLSLKTKPFLMLYGSEGCGKYSLVRLFCESIGITPQNGRFKTVSTYNNYQPLYNHMGYRNSDNTFCPGEVLKFIIKAASSKDEPYVLYIDDINKTDPDKYLCEIIKSLDSVRLDENGILISEPIFSADLFETEDEKEMFGNIKIPDNLYIICSICRDENCFSLSSKLKDRANIIELKADSLKEIPQTTNPCDPLTNITNEFLRQEYFDVTHIENTNYIQIFASILYEINKPLKYANKEFGYRVRNEILFYLMLNKKYGLLTDNDAFDNCIYQRILPKIEGSEPSIKNILSLIFRQCVTKGIGDYYTNSLKMFRSLSHPDCHYKKSAEKITFMTRRLEESDLCTFF